ncbi:MAG: PQQ-binding-like beta-propeller repeat protein, partial [Actinomycetota bacterium]
MRRCQVTGSKWIILTGAAALLLARGVVTAGELDPASGEIQLQGVIRTVDPAAKSFVLAAASFTLPNGGGRRFSEPKLKTVEVADAALHVREQPGRRVALSDLKAGVHALVVGKDLGSGKALPARDVAVWNRVEGKQYLFGPAAAPAAPKPKPAAPAPPVERPAAATALPGDWPQWRGPDRTGLSRETGLLAAWPQNGPTLLWRAAGIGGGYSTPTVAAGRVYGMGYRGNAESVWCLDGATGRGVWSTPIASANRQVGYGEGSRCSPTVDGDRLYVLGVSGDLVCLDATTGATRWQHSFTREYGGEIPSWGYSESPLVDGSRVIACPGGREATMVAFDKLTGRELWRSLAPGGEGAQ